MHFINIVINNRFNEIKITVIMLIWKFVSWFFHDVIYESLSWFSTFKSTSAKNGTIKKDFSSFWPKISWLNLALRRSRLWNTDENESWKAKGEKPLKENPKSKFNREVFFMFFFVMTKKREKLMNIQRLPRTFKCATSGEITLPQSSLTNS